VAKTRAAKAYARANTYLMPVITAIMLFFIILSIANLISNVSAREGIREIGPRANLLIPVINPFLPLTYTLVALIISVFIHEAGHGIVARVYGIKVESTGIAFVLFVPVGAFVNLDRDELTNATLKQKSAVLTAGPLNNMILAGISFAVLFATLSSLTPIASNVTSNGIELITVAKGSLAEEIGLTEGSKIISIGNSEIQSQGDLTQVLRSNIGNQIPIVWLDKNGVQRSDTFSIPANAAPDKPILGVTAASIDPTTVLEIYKQHPLLLLQMPTLEKSMPFSDSMAPKYQSNLFGESFPIVANTFYWLFFINFNLGLFNSLPISILDGGQLYSSLIESRSKMDKNRLNQISSAVSTITILIVAMSLLLPYLPF
jgi:Zn-dependent protease